MGFQVLPAIYSGIIEQVIKDYQLFIVVFVLLCVDIAIMTTWQIVDPFYRTTKEMPTIVSHCFVIFLIFICYN